MLQVDQLVKHFPVPQSLWGLLTRRKAAMVRAVDNVSFSIEKGEVLALVGESGCGKTTIARTVIGLEKPTSGQIIFNGHLVDVVARQQHPEFAPLEPGSPGTPEQKVLPFVSLRRLHQKAQMIFQDPYESLDPRATIFDIVAEGLEVNGLARKRSERVEKVQRALDEAGLRPAEDYFWRYPHELSGGQRQRVVIAGAMVMEPDLIVADEPVSMLDVSIRADILNLLRQMRNQRGVSILFITHDMGTVAYFADRVAVMYLGRIVEIGPTRQVLQNPLHPYTQALLSVVPVPNPRLRRKRVILQGETPNPIHIPLYCRFQPRCPRAFERCTLADPSLMQPVRNVSGAVSGGEQHQAACFLLE